MATGTMLADALILMMVGMGVVFAFLSLLIAAVALISWLDNKLPNPAPSTSQAVREPNKVSVEQLPSPQILAAITAAVHQFRQRR